jgi:hypothetical protein
MVNQSPKRKRAGLCAKTVSLVWQTTTNVRIESAKTNLLYAGIAGPSFLPEFPIQFLVSSKAYACLLVESNSDRPGDVKQLV